MKEYDLFGSTYPEKHSLALSVQPPWYREEMVSQDNIVPMLSPFVVNTTINPSEKGGKCHPNMEKVPNIYLCVNKGLELIKKREEEQQWKYDVIIRTRFDMDYNDNIKKFIDEAVRKEIMTINTEGVQPADAIIIAPRNIFENFVAFALKQFISPVSEMCWTNPPHGILEAYLLTHSFEEVYMGRFIRPIFSPKIAVLVCGNVRTWEECNNNWMWDGDIDVFASTYTERYNYHPYILSLIGPLQERTITYQTLSKHPFKSIEMRSSERDISAEASFHPKMKEIFHGYYQYTCVKRGLEMIANYEKEEGIKYDIIIRTRFDMDYHPSFNYKTLIDAVGKDTIIINQWGYPPADTFIMAKRDILFALADYAITQYTSPENETSWTAPPHGILTNFLRDTKVAQSFVGQILRAVFKEYVSV